MSISSNLETIRNRINDACKKCGRDPAEVKLMAVSKFHPVEEIYEALDAGQKLFGENHVQEACLKFPGVFEKSSEAQVHMIGHLQTNKVAGAVKISSCIQSVDSLKLIREIEKQCAKIGKTITVLLELHTGEESKSGFGSEAELEEALEYIAQGNAAHLVPKGFMTMAPFTEDKDAVRKSFITLREVSERMKNKFPAFDLCELSMGMSGDFETAIEEGSTLVRVGTAIFGERKY